MLELRVISIGALAAHPLWGERTPVRTGHATCTLLRTGDLVVLIDPGLPEQAMVARLAERANITPEQVTHVFLTSFHTDTHRGIGAFEHATWWISRAEREGVGVPMIGGLRHAVEQGNRELRQALEREVAILERCEETPEAIAEDVDVFPLPGVTPGLCGLLVTEGESATLVCGDAAPTVEHIRRRLVLPWSVNVDAAKASFSEALEIAEWLIPGRDNLMPCPARESADEAAARDEDEDGEGEGEGDDGDGGGLARDLDGEDLDE